jgi:hypothetical protein
MKMKKTIYLLTATMIFSSLPLQLFADSAHTQTTESVPEITEAPAAAEQPEAKRQVDSIPDPNEEVVTPPPYKGDNIPVQ